MALIELETDIHKYSIEEVEVDIKFPFYMRDNIYFYKFLNEYEYLIIYISKEGTIELQEFPAYFDLESFDNIGEVHINGGKILDAINNNYNCRIIKEEEFTEKFEKMFF